MNKQNQGHPVEILLVEDNPGDVRLTLEALKEGKVNNKIHVVKDGVEALAFVNQEGAYRDVSLPELILLDLNLPRKDGRQVLAEIKANPRLKHIPVIVLTTSEAKQDIRNAYQLHANCYITKPIDLDQFLNIIRGIEDFWLTVVKLPAH